MNPKKFKYDSYVKRSKIHLAVIAVCLVFYLVVLVLDAFSPDILDEHLTMLLINGDLIVLFAAALIALYYNFNQIAPALKESDELQKTAFLDDLTGMPNRYSCDLVFEMYGKNQSIENIGCALIIIGNLVTINATSGRDAGNQVIIDFCRILEDIGEDFGFVGRNGGNEFLLVIEDCNKEKMDDFFRQLDDRLTRYNCLELNDAIDIYYKYVLNQDLKADRFSDVITAVYRALHTSAKRDISFRHRY